MKLAHFRSAAVLRSVLLAFSLFTLAACGFQLRSMADLSFKTAYLPQSGSPLIKELRRSLRSSGITIVPTPAEAEMQLEIMEERVDKNILSLSGGGKVREYELLYHVTYRWREASSELWGQPQSIEQRRDYSYDDTQLLAKESEEARLYNDMRSEAAREIMRRLNAMGAAKAKATR